MPEKKSKKERKAERQSYEDARKMTAGKLVRLVLKSMVFAVSVAVIMLLLSLLGVPALNSLWVQFGVMFAVYILAYPYLMSEFRPKKVRK